MRQRIESLNEKRAGQHKPPTYSSVVRCVSESRSPFRSSRAPRGAVKHSFALKPSETAHCDVASSDLFFSTNTHTQSEKVTANEKQQLSKSVLLWVA